MFLHGYVASFKIRLTRTWSTTLSRQHTFENPSLFLLFTQSEDCSSNMITRSMRRKQPVICDTAGGVSTEPPRSTPAVPSSTPIRTRTPARATQRPRPLYLTAEQRAAVNQSLDSSVAESLYHYKPGLDLDPMMDVDKRSDLSCESSFLSKADGSSVLEDSRSENGRCDSKQSSHRGPRSIGLETNRILPPCSGTASRLPPVETH